MPYRTNPLITNHYYHVFNRGVEKRVILTDDREFQRFLATVIYYQRNKPEIRFSQASDEIREKTTQPKLVEILSYCLMPNHFHLLLKQLEDNGISNFVRRTINSYTRYFNTKNKRVGPLFQGQFKAIRIQTNEQLIHVSRYIHLNPIVDYLVKDLRQYKWSSYQEYLGAKYKSLCNTSEVLNLFHSKAEYEKFVLDRVDYAKQLEEIKHLLANEN